MKKYILIILLLFISMTDVLAFNTNKKIYDYAQVLTQNQEKKLKKDIDLFIANANIDMVLITVKHYNKENTKSYATEFYNTNGFGLGEQKSGIVGVIDLSNKLVKFSFTKYGTATDMFDSEATKKIVNNVNSKQEKSYYKMFSTFTEETIDHFYKIKKIKVLDNNIIMILKISLISFIVTVLYILILLLKIKNKKKNKKIEKNYLEKNSFEINKNITKFVTTQTKTIKNK